MVGKIPTRYAPAYLSKRDRSRQKKAILRSRRSYKKGKYVGRPILKSARTRKSKHINRIRKIYKFPDGKISLKKLAKRSGCTKKAFDRILSKGRGAFYSSGSRPNQTAESWAIARLYSTLTGGPASKIDRHIMEEDCKSNSKALKMAIKGGGKTKKKHTPKAPRMKERIIRFERSKAKGKKYTAFVKELGTGNVRKISFGGLGYAQYKDRTGIGAFSNLDHGDRARMGRYFLRHSGTRNRARAIAKEKILSNGIYNPKILSHVYLW